MKANRGEIWRVEFDPSTGQEIGKIRPAVIVSENSIGRLPLKIQSDRRTLKAFKNRKSYRMRIYQLKVKTK